MSQTLEPNAFLRSLFARAVEVADPMRFMAAHLPRKPDGRLVVVGAGKASARMAEAVEAQYGPCEGLVVTRYGYSRPCQGIEILEASHPVPDQAGLDATTRLLTLLDGLSSGDQVIALISGGGSALLCSPVEGLTLADKIAVNEALLASGAPIGVMNQIRKELSRVKGGGLAQAAFPAGMLSLMISDVPGDEPGEIASGPTVGHMADPKRALAEIERWSIAVPASVSDLLRARAATSDQPETLAIHVENRIVAAPLQSLEAAAALARDAVGTVRILGDAIEGEARDVARAHIEVALCAQRAMTPTNRAILFLSGGECTVTRRGNGIGGPNAEYVLAATLAADGAPGIHVLAADTDGVDGAAEVAGAVAGPETLARSIALGLDAAAALAENDAHRFFGALGDQIVTGPTLTNVNDFRAILVEPVTA